MRLLPSIGKKRCMRRELKLLTFALRKNSIVFFARKSRALLQNRNGNGIIKKEVTNCPVLLVTIVNREKSEYFLDVIQSFHCNFQFSSFAVGTAQRALGLLTPDVEKAVLFSVVTKENVPKALSTLEEKFATIRGGGVAFTVPISGTVGVLIYRFLCNKG